MAGLVVGTYGATDSTGWSSYSGTPPANIFYVANGGNDAGTGTFASPFATLNGAVNYVNANVVNGTEYWILLKEGDTFLETATDIFVNIHGPTSSTNPVIISSYNQSSGAGVLHPAAGARPLIKIPTNASAGVFLRPHAALDSLAIIGIDFYAFTRNPSDVGYAGSSGAGNEEGILFNATAGNFLLIEDCAIRFCANGVHTVANATTTSGTHIFRRNLVADCYPTPGTSALQGYNPAAWNSLTVEENVFIHNGWNATNKEAATGSYVFVRNIYVYQSNLNCIFRGNISAQSASDGCQARPNNSDVYDNLFIQNILGYSLGQTDTLSEVVTNANCYNNVITEAVDLGWWMASPATRGQGTAAVNCDGTGAGSITMHDDIYTTATSQGGAWTDLQVAGGATTKGVSVTNNIIFKWGFAANDESGLNTVTPNNVNLAGTTPWNSYTDPTRTVGSYSTTIGGAGTTADFLTQIRGQCKNNWNVNLTAHSANNYIRAGFGIVASRSGHGRGLKYGF